MRTKAANLGLFGSAVMLILSVFMAIIAPMLHDMMSADPAVQAAENLEEIIFGLGGFIVAGVGFAGSLLHRRNKKLSYIFLICSVILCFIFALIVGSIVQSKLFFCIVSIPGVILTIACVLSFLPVKSSNITNDYI